MIRLPLTDYVPGVVYRANQTELFAQPVESVMISRALSSPWKPEISLVVKRLLSKTCDVEFRLDTNPPADLTRALDRRGARDWGELAYHHFPLALWHLIPALDEGFRLPSTRAYRYHRPVSPEHLRSPHQKDWTLHYDYDTCRLAAHRAIPLPEESREAFTAGLQRVLHRLPQVFGGRARLELRYPTLTPSAPDASQTETRYAALRSFDHTQECLGRLSATEHAILSLRFGLDGGPQLTTGDIDGSGLATKAKVPYLEDTIMAHLRTIACEYASQPYTSDHQEM